MFLEKRGYSFVMWSVVFAIVIAASAILFTPVKRAITGKILKTTDWGLWGVWGDEKQDEGGWNHNQIGALVAETSQIFDNNEVDKNKVLENKGKVKTMLNVTSRTTSSYASY